MMVLLLALAVSAGIQQLGGVRTAGDQLEKVRIPVMQASVDLLNSVNRSAAELRGWVFLRDSSFIESRHEVWNSSLLPALATLDSLLLASNEPTAQMRLAELHALVDHLQKEQLNVEQAERRMAERLVTERSIPALIAAREGIQALVEKQKILTRADLDDMNARMNFLGTLQWMLLAAGLLLGIALAWLITRSIIKPVNSAVTVAGNIARGDLETEVPVQGSRELAVLGTALGTMRDSLRSRLQEIERHNWFSRGHLLLDDAMRGEKGVGPLASDITRMLAGHTGAQVGTLYVRNGSEQMHLAGSFAMDRDAPATLYPGHGLMGQAMLDREIRVMAVPQEALRISSSVIDTAASQILIAPFEFEGSVLGVLELGKLGAFDPDQVEFVKTAMHNVAVAVNGALASRRIKELLEETRRQSEELQAQQEELQQTNEELEEQAQRLKVQQEELQVTNEELEEQTQAVEQRNHDLEAARNELQRKAKELETTGRYKSEFLANMSHELRTPLNSLLILSNHLARNKRGNLEDDQVECAQVIARSGQDLLALINDILDLSKVESGRIDLDVTRVNAGALANDLRSSFKHMAEEKHITFEVDLADDMPSTVLTDRQRLGQVLNNLVSNAVKFTHQGGVTVQFAGAPEGGWRIAVADTGIGIPQEKQHLVFEAFQQADGGTARKYGGTGLGLSISRELARLLGGNITLASGPGRGSTFTLLLPARTPDRQAAHEFPSPTPIRSLGRRDKAIQGHEAIQDRPRLLIIEDDPTFANILAGQAGTRGFEVITTASGENGLEAARLHRPHAILLDLHLPGMNGHTVLRELKGDPDLRHIPVHILSVHERTLEPLRAGAVEYLVKPVDQEQLDGAFDRIEDLMRRRVKNLLVIEDDASQRMAIKTLIGNGDVNYLEASTAAEGIEKLQQHDVDLVVLDIGLPDATGLQFLKRMQESRGASLPPIIIYTGRELTSVENDELRMYAETIIVKGIRSEERLLDETALFLHRTVKDLPARTRSAIMDLHDKDDILRDRRILVVDDDVRNVFALSKVLSSRSLQVLRASNGNEALAMLEKEIVDMVLMDIMMPEMDGYTCIRKIRERPALAELPVIALTAKAMKDDRRKCIDAGANDYVTKPVDADRLISLMRIWMGRERVS
jgi:CheY-like chemotaxis protein